MTRKGYDAAWNPPSAADAKAQGYTFAIRYLSHDPSKDVTRAEIDELWANDMDVVLVFESTETRPRSGYTGGVADAEFVDQYLDRLGLPIGTFVYYAIDYPEAYAEIEVVAHYALGWCDVRTPYNSGPYGNYNVVRILQEHEMGRLYWQTASESGGQWNGNLALQQVQFGVHIGASEVDVDQAVAVDFGQVTRQSKPAATTVGKEGETMLVRESDKPHVYVGNGITRRWVGSEDELHTLQASLRAAGLSDAVTIIDPGHAYALGQLVGPDPLAPPPAS